MIREDLVGLPEGKEAPEVSGASGRDQSFEIEIDGIVVYSKLSTGQFPDATSAVAVIRSVVVDGAHPSDVKILRRRQFC